MTFDLGDGWSLEITATPKEPEGGIVDMVLSFGAHKAFRALDFELLNYAKGSALSHIIIGMAQDIVREALSTSGTGIDLEAIADEPV